MYIPSAQMGEYDSWKPPPQKRMSSKQILEAKYGGGGGASLERQSSSGRFSGVERTASRGRLESGGGSLARSGSSGGLRVERQDSRARVSRQGSSSRLERQESRGKMTPSRQSSQRQLVRHDSHHGHHHGHSHSCGHSHGESEAPAQSDVERQIRRLASSGRFSQDQRGTAVRDTYQANNKRGWQNSLRGASASDQRAERGGGGAARPRSDRNAQPEHRQRSSRSESGSPSGRLFASTFSSRAKKSEQTNEEEARLVRRNSRASPSPQRPRSRANSVSQEESRRPSRRSQDKTPGRTSSLPKRRSVNNFTDEEEGALEDTDPFLAYRSFKQFQNEEGNSGSLKRETSKTSASYSERKLSNSLSGAKISSGSSGYDSLKLDSKPYTPAKLSSDGRNGLGGIFSSTPKYQDSTGELERGSLSSSLTRHSSSSMFSNGDSGYSASSSSFSSFSGSSITKRNSGVFSGDNSGGKISLGSLKKPSTESWDNSNSSMFRRGVSSTYIG